jgi:hypothetical protein
LTPTEAGATAVVVTIIIGFIIKTLKLSDFPAMLVSSAKVNGVILPIIAFSHSAWPKRSPSLACRRASLARDIGQREPLHPHPDDDLHPDRGRLRDGDNAQHRDPGADPLAARDKIGMNEIQFCIMMITALGVGFITPPLGLNLFVVSGITGESILKIAYRAIPFVFFMLIVTLMIAYVPALSTSLLPEIYRRTSFNDYIEYLKKAPLTSKSDSRPTPTKSFSRSSMRSRLVATKRRWNMPPSSTSMTGNILLTREEIEAASAQVPRTAETRHRLRPRQCEALRRGPAQTLPDVEVEIVPA